VQCCNIGSTVQCCNKNLQSNKQDFIVCCINYNVFHNINEPSVIQWFLLSVQV
jgi:hypothetical protein